MHDQPLQITPAPGRHADVVILSIDGPLTLQNLFAFQQEMATHKPQVLIVDLTRSSYMDSAGLGALMNCYVSAEKNGRRLLLAGANYRILALMETTKVNTLLKNFPTAEEAEASARP